MPLIDRDAVLRQTDLRALATETCGPPQGNGPGARWHCPNPAHPDAHPSMGIFRGKRGHDRWKCRACGEGGTAIDLLLVARPGLAVRPALVELARRAGLDPAAAVTTPRPQAAGGVPSPPADPSPAPPETGREPDPAIDQVVSAAARLLWEPVGADALRYLHSRGFTDPVLALNKVGFDPGPRHLDRPGGLPRRGPGVVFPALDPATGRAVYYQLRYLASPGGQRYDQPTVARAANPRIATLSPLQPADHPLVVICEGYPDALTAVHTGLAASAVLGTSHTGRGSVDHLADLLLARHPDAAFLVCFDSDNPVNPPPPGAQRTGQNRTGQDGAGRLADRLAHHQRLVLTIVPPDGTTDLNQWWQHDPDDVRRVLTGTAAHFTPSPPALTPVFAARTTS